MKMQNRFLGALLLVLAGAGPCPGFDADNTARLTVNVAANTCTVVYLTSAVPPVEKTIVLPSPADGHILFRRDIYTDPEEISATDWNDFNIKMRRQVKDFFVNRVHAESYRHGRVVRSIELVLE